MTNSRRISTHTGIGPGIALLGLLGAACASGVPTDSDTPAVVLLAVSPEGGMTGVNAGMGLSVRFSGPMRDGMERFVDLHRGSVAGPVLAMSCTWSDGSTQLRCTPGSPLEHQTMYVLHLGGHMLATNGHPVDLNPGTHMGGTMANAGMMGSSHQGDMMGGMGPGWRHDDGTYGMIFPFTTQ
jgi:hypothetical protein